MEQQPSLEILYTGDGYLHLSEEIARLYFPGDTLLIVKKGAEIMLLPTRGAAAGGLILKQRNSAGDRSVLAAPYLPEDVVPGNWPCFWDERGGALRVGFRAEGTADEDSREPAIAAKGVVEWEGGRWVVFLELAFSSPGSSEIRTERRRMGDYSTEARANIAAHWIERGAENDRGRPQLGF